MAWTVASSTGASGSRRDAIRERAASKAVTWPAGFRLVSAPAGPAIADWDGQLVLRDGEEFEAGGEEVYGVFRICVIDGTFHAREPSF